MTTIFRRINSTKGKKTFLLKENGYKSIKEAKRENGFTGSDDAMYDILKDEYNHVIETLQEEKKILLSKRRKIISKSKKDTTAFLSSFNIEEDPVDKARREYKPELKVERRLLFQQSKNNNFFVLNYPRDMIKCLKTIKEKDEEDVMYAYRNMMNRRNNKVNKYSFNVNSIQDCKVKLMNLYRQQKKAFKISIQFGFVMESNAEKKKGNCVAGVGVSYSVFTATSNKFYREAVLITNMKQLNTLMNGFNFDEIYKYVDSMRPSTMEKIIGITTMDVKIFDMEYRIGASIELPDYILKNQNINSMADSANNMCFWNCVAFHTTKVRKCYSEGKKLYEKFYNSKAKKTYGGFDIYNELVKFEKDFKIGVNIFELGKQNEMIEIRHSLLEDNKMNLLLYQNHFCYIRELETIEGTKFKCDKCGHLFRDKTDFERHNCKDHVKKDTFSKFPEVYEPERNLIITYNEIFGTNCDFRYEPIIVFDFESRLQVLNKQITKNRKLVNKHEVISVSINSNIVGYEEVIFLVNNNPADLIKEMFEKFDEMTAEAEEMMEERYDPLFNEINKIEDVALRLKYLKRLEDYVSQVPILGFNSGMYDININITEFMNELKGGKITAIKNGNTYKALIGGRFKFLDITQYIPPDYNLDKYITAFNPNGCKKSIFPYEYVSSYDRLNDDINHLTRESFFSTLKNKGISVKEWEEFVENKKKYEWKTVMDLLRYYNNLDVKPFLEAVLNHREFFYDLNIDMFKDGFSLPALAEKIMFSYELEEFNNDFIHRKLYPNYALELFQNTTERLNGYKQQDKQPFKIVKEKGKNGEVEEKKVSKKVVYDEDEFITKDEIKDVIQRQGGKCLYCWKKCDVENWSLDRIDNNKGHNSKNCVLSCINCNKQRSDMFHTIFYRKKRLLHYSYYNPLIHLISEENKEAFYKLKQNITGGASIVFHRHHEAGETRIKRPVYENGEWKEGVEGKEVKNITGYDANALYLWCIGENMLCGNIKYETGEDWDFDNDFGAVEVDIETPVELYNEMGESPLIFKNVEYDANEVMGEYMEGIYTDKKEKRMTRKLVSSFRGEKILIKSDRLKWLVSKGLRITKIHGYIKAKRGKVFQKFVEKVSEFRRKGDKDPKYAIIAEMWKLVGNSAFGRTGMNKNKFYKTIYGDEDTYNKEVASFLFKDANEYGELYEITKYKKTTRQNIPIQVACSIYDDSKLKMSMFYYDCVTKYISKEDFQYIEMDTDSAYMAMTGTFEELVK